MGEEGSQVNQRFYWILAVIFAVTAFIIIILTGVSLNQAKDANVEITQIESASNMGGGRMVNGQVVWSIAIGHDYGAHEYFNTGGELDGFGVEMIHAVCKAADIRCEVIWDIYDNCWDSTPGHHSSGGKGILGHWYDGCAGWWQTIPRQQVLIFSKEYMPQEDAYFYTPINTQFDTKDITNKSVGFIEGWAIDEKCLARQTSIKGSLLTLDQVNLYPDAKTLAQAVKNGQVDVGFSSERTMEAYVADSTVTEAGDKIQCLSGGNSIMFRKDSGLRDIWNKGFDIIKKNGKYKEMCDNAKKNHGAYGTIRCIDV